MRPRPVLLSLLSNENCEKINVELSDLFLLLSVNDAVCGKNCLRKKKLSGYFAEKVSVCRKLLQWQALYANNNMNLP